MISGAAPIRSAATGSESTTSARHGNWRSVDETFRPALQEVLRAAGELLTFDDPLDVELWASELVAMWRGLDLVDAEAERVYGESLLRLARRDAGPEALACLHALAAVSAPPLASQARQIIDELQRRGVRAASWAAKLRHVQVVGAWTACDPYGDQEAVLLAFAHRGREPHTFLLLVDHNFGGMVKDGFLTDTALEQVLDEWYPCEAWVLRAVDPADAAAKVRRGLEVRDQCLASPQSRSLEDCRVLLDARLGLCPDRPVSDPGPLDVKARRELVESFFSSGEAAEAPDDGRLVGLLVDYRCDFCGEDPLRWSPTVVLLFLLDWLPRRVTLPPDSIRRMPGVLRAWVRFAGRRRGLPPDLVEEIVAAVDEVEDDYLEAVTDPSNFGPAKAAVGAMLKDGVDVTDEAEVDAWLVDFRLRLAEERHQLLHA